MITTRVKVAGRTVAGSRSSPRYLVTDERSGARAVRQRGSLRPLTAEKHPSGRRRIRPPRPPGRVPRPDWRVVAGVLVGVAVTAIVLAYFTQLPNRFADDYREDAAPAFERVDEAMYGVFQSFRADYFRGLGIEDLARKRVGEDLGRLRRAYRKQYRTDRAAIDRAGTAMERAEAAIAEAESDLSEVGGMPFLGGVGELAQAGDEAEAAEEYLRAAREFMPRFRELIAYSKRTLAIEEEITAAILDNAPAAGASLQTFRSTTERTIDQLGKARKRFQALDDPPATAEPFHYATDRGLGLSLDYFRQIRTAFQQLNVGLLDRAAGELRRKLRGFGVGVLTRFGELQDESPISTAIDELEEIEDELAERLGAEAGEESVVPPLIPPDDRGEQSPA